MHLCMTKGTTHEEKEWTPLYSLYSIVTKTTNERWEEEKILFNLFIIYLGLFLIQVVFGPVFDLMVFGPFLLTDTSLCFSFFSFGETEGPKDHNEK